jgi:hypothetical protein
MKGTAAGSRDRQTPRAERQRVLRSRDAFWRPEDLAGSPSTRQHLLSSLVQDGELRRVRRGLYWRGARSPLGMSPPPTEALVQVLAPGAGVGPAGLSAANLLRLSTQIPRRAEVAVPARAPSDAGPIRFVARPARRNRETARLSPAEVAFLEVLESWEKVLEVSPQEARTRLAHLMASGDVRADRLARAGRSEPGSVRARLRELLASSGRPDLAARVPAPDPRTAAIARRKLMGTT